MKSTGAGAVSPPQPRQIQRANQGPWLPAALSAVPYVATGIAGSIAGLFLTAPIAIAVAVAVAVPVGMLCSRVRQGSTLRLLAGVEPSTSDALIAQMYSDASGPRHAWKPRSSAKTRA